MIEPKLRADNFGKMLWVGNQMNAQQTVAIKPSARIDDRHSNNLLISSSDSETVNKHKSPPIFYSRFEMWESYLNDVPEWREAAL